MSALAKKALAATFMLLLAAMLAVPSNPQSLPMTSAGCTPLSGLSCYWANSTQSCWVSDSIYPTNSFVCDPQVGYPEDRCLYHKYVIRKGTYYCWAYVDEYCGQYPNLTVTNSTSCPGNGEATPTETPIFSFSYNYNCC